MNLVNYDKYFSLLESNSLSEEQYFLYCGAQSIIVFGNSREECIYVCYFRQWVVSSCFQNIFEVIKSQCHRQSYCVLTGRKIPSQKNIKKGGSSIQSFVTIKIISLHTLKLLLTGAFLSVCKIVLHKSGCIPFNTTRNQLGNLQTIVNCIKNLCQVYQNYTHINIQARDLLPNSAYLMDNTEKSFFWNSRQRFFKKI